MNSLIKVISGALLVLALGSAMGEYGAKQTETYKTGAYVLQKVEQCGDCSIAVAMLEGEQ